MKKFLMTAVFAAFALTAGAQSQNVWGAFTDMRKGYLDKAKSQIDAACLHEDTKGDAKTWCYKALIYSQIGGSEKEKYRNLAPDWAEQSYSAALECQRLDTKKEFESLVNQVLNFVAQEYYNQAYEAYNGMKYSKAIEFAEKSIVGFNKSGNSNYAQDAMLIAGVCSLATRDTVNTLKHFNQMVMGKTDNNYVYSTLFRIHKEKNDRANAMKVAKTYVSNCKTDYYAYLMLAEGYLLFNNVEKSKEQINTALRMTKDSVVLYPKVLVLAAGVLERSGDYDGAIAKYNESLRLKPNQFEANFSLGSMYYNRAADKINAANAIDPFDDSKTGQYEKLNKEAQELFRQSIPYLEKAVAYIDGLTDANEKAYLRANLYNALSALEITYTRFDMLKEAQAIQVRREQLLKQ